MKLYKLISIALLANLFFGCTGNEKTIRIGYLPIAECLPLYVANEKGYFEEQGLNIELIPQSGGPSIFKELYSENIEIGFSNVVTLIKQNYDGIEYKSVFGSTLESKTNNNHAIFSKKNTEGNNTYGVNARYNIEELMLRRYLKENGIPIKNSITSKFQAIPFPKMISQLKDSEVTNICLVEPFLTMAKLDTTLNYIGNHYPVNKRKETLVATYVSKTSLIKDENEIIKKFKTAMSKATIDINNDTESAKKYLLQYTKIRKEILHNMSLSKFKSDMDSKDLQYIINLISDKEINYDNNFFDSTFKLPNARDMIYE